MGGLPSEMVRSPLRELEGYSKGFSLIETLVVIAIILILAAILLPVAYHKIEDARVARLVEEIRSLETAVMSFYLDVGRIPDAKPYFSSNCWGRGISCSFWRFDELIYDTSLPNWRGPYLDRPPNRSEACYLSPWNTCMSFYTFYGSCPLSWSEGTLPGSCNLVEVYFKVGSQRVISQSTVERVDCILDDCNLNTGFVYLGDTDHLVIILKASVGGTTSR